MPRCVKGCYECRDDATWRVGEFEIIAYGQPAPQGSKRHVGRGVMIESSKRVAPWRSDVKAAAEAFIATLGADWAPLDRPLTVRMVFTLKPPQRVAGRTDAKPDRTPDLSKLVRSTEDALTDAGIWADDARVTEYERLAKCYPGCDPEALDRPGVRIVIR